MSINNTGPQYLFEKSKKNKKAEGRDLNRKKLLFLFLAVFLLFLFFLYTRSSLSKIRYIEISGNRLVSNTEILRTGEVKEGDSRLFLSVSKLKKRLLQIPLIRSVNVKKTFSGLLKLEIEEYKPLYYVIADGVSMICEDKSVIGISSDRYHTLLNVPLVKDYEAEEISDLLMKLDESVRDAIVSIRPCPLSYDEDVCCLEMNDGNNILVSRDKLDLANSYFDILPSLKSQNICLYYDKISHNAYTSACPWEKPEADAAETKEEE